VKFDCLVFERLTLRSTFGQCVRRRFRRICCHLDRLGPSRLWFSLVFCGRAILIKQRGEVHFLPGRENCEFRLSRDRLMRRFLNWQTEMTLKRMPEFPYPIRRLFIAPQNMSRVFDANNRWLLQSQSGLF
jgi:hypothetical protein